MMEDKARFVAVSTLYDMEVKKSYSNIKLNEYFIKYDLNSLDRSFATEILYGTIRWKLKIDYLIQKNISTRIDEMSLWVLVCLRTAIYQIFIMDKVPEFAAVNEAVKLVKINEEKAAAFVNGILRNILRNKEEFDNIGIKNKTKRLSIQYSHPEWFIRKFQALFGERFVIDLMNINNTPPELTARVNTLKISRAVLITELEKEGFSIQEGNLDESIILDGYSMIEKSKEFNSGYFIFQDESSMLVSKVLDPKPGDIVIDLCSAPGGKTTHLAGLMNNEGKILAFDIHKHKLELIRENAEKLGINIIKTFEGDATVFNESLYEYGDKVLIDAPCSGLGLIRKKPEIRWNITEGNILELKKLQIDILDNASKYLKKGGILVYSTCTISEEENEEIILEFLANNPNFKLEAINNYLPDKYKSDNGNKGFTKLFPNIHDCDGFFISRLRKEW
jgi:16S rRNA (cytosine967-C5)-methyltransferase